MGDLPIGAARYGIDGIRDGSNRPTSDAVPHSDAGSQGPQSDAEPIGPLATDEQREAIRQWRSELMGVTTLGLSLFGPFQVVYSLRKMANFVRSMEYF